MLHYILLPAGTAIANLQLSQEAALPSSPEVRKKSIWICSIFPTTHYCCCKEASFARTEQISLAQILYGIE